MKTIITILLFFTLGITSSAQNDSISQLYNKAEKYYDIGRTDDALLLLEKNINKFSPEFKASALRLCALCHMAAYDEVNTRKYARRLLDEAPGYISNNDPIRFRDLIAELQTAIEASITTASSSYETLEETPVPVTLITEDMIKACGAHTVQDALIAYVPSISPVEDNGMMNFSYRGIHGAGQDIMLIMLNGIRLNSFSTNIASADYSIDINKIKQIEVLRGPASSLYGDAALTGVVNIITKSGRDVDGVEANAAVGNYGQTKGSVVVGKHLFNCDILTWGSIYRSDGQKVKNEFQNSYYSVYPIQNDVLLGAYNRKPAYEYGVSLKYKELSFTYFCNSAKNVMPYTKSDYFFEDYYPYAYWSYNGINGNMPGIARTTHNIKTAYIKDLGRFNIAISLTYNREQMSKYYITADSTADSDSINPLNFFKTSISTFDQTTTSEPLRNGLGTFTEWEDDNSKIGIRLMYNYGRKKNGGTITMGADGSIFRMIYRNVRNVYDFGTQMTRENSSFLNPPYNLDDKETKNNFLIQLKHRFGRLIINSGLRIDFKKHAQIIANKDRLYTRFKDTIAFAKYKIDILDKINQEQKIHEYSPRISLIYMLERLNFKLNFSKSFVDAPYMARTNGYNILYYGKPLIPETAYSLQFTVSGHDFVQNLTSEVNFFYNKYENLIITDDYMYDNWNVPMAGVEAVATYKKNKLSLTATAIFQKVVKDEPITYDMTDIYVALGNKDLAPEDYLYTVSDVYGNDICNVPAFMFNAVASYQICQKMRLNANFNYMGRQYFKFCYDEELEKNEYYKIPQVFLVNPSVNLYFGKFEFDLQIHNIFNHKYSLGGKCYYPIQQKGLWLMAGASYKF